MAHFERNYRDREAGVLHRALCLVLAIALVGWPAGGLASPSGENVVAGDVEFHRDGSVTWIRASDGAIIEYDSFDVFAGEVVEFIQPGADARVLNRVFGDATQIDGSVLANGIVYILNPAGVFFGGEAVVDTGGLVAAAGTLTNEDFLAGVDRFELTGAVENEGDLTGVRGVSLLGRSVANHGNIATPDGTIALVAGDKVVLMQLGRRVMVEVDGAGDPAAEAAVVHTGTADAGTGRVIFTAADHYSLAINHDGITRGRDVELDGGDGMVRVAGEIDATSDGQGGTIHVLGDRVGLFGASLDASGDTGGGEIRVGGDVRGGDALPRARRTVVDGESVLRADARESGDGGEIVVWGDEAAVFAGALSARGGAAQGDGGFAEISSLGLLRSEGSVDLGAANGQRGTLLYDPTEIRLRGGSADGSDDPNVGATPAEELIGDDGTLGSILFDDIGDGSEPFEIFESEIESTDADIVLEARHGITADDATTFTNEADGEGVGVLLVGNGNDLTLRTRNTAGDEVGATGAAGIDLGDLAIRSVDGDVTLVTGDDGEGMGGDGDAASITVGDIATAGGNATLRTQNGSIAAGAIDTTPVTGFSGSVDVEAGAAEDGTGDVTLAGPVTASLGNPSVSLRAAGALEFDPAVTVPQIVTGGAVTLAGTTVGAVSPIEIDGGGTADSRLEVSAEDTADVRVTTAGFRFIDVTATSAEADIDVTQVAEDGSDNAVTVDIDGAAGVSTIVQVDATRGDGDTAINFEYRLEDALTEGDDIAIAVDVPTGAVTSDGGVAIESEDGITLGADAIRVENGAASVLVTADVDDDGDGSIDGVAGGLPEIAAEGDVVLRGVSVGALAAIEIDANPVETDGEALDSTLAVAAADTANVDVVNAGFNSFGVNATANEADIDVTQVAEKAGGNGVTIDIDGTPGANRIVTVDTRQIDDPDSDTVGTAIDFQYVLQDSLTEGDDVALAAVVEAGAITAGGTVDVFSEDDLTLEDGAITLNEILDPDLFPDDPDPDAMLPTGLLQVRADFDEDGTGAISGTAGGGAEIVTEGDIQLSGVGVGAGDPVEIDGGGTADSQITITASETAAVDVSNAGFSVFFLEATSAEADFDVTQAAEMPGGDGVTIEVSGSGGTSTIETLDTRQTDEGTAGNAVAVDFLLQDTLEGDDDVAQDIVVATGAITAGATVQIRGEDDVRLEDGSVSMHEVLDGDPAIEGDDVATGTTGLFLAVADVDEDATGAITGEGGVAIDSNADGVEDPGLVALQAAEGVGTEGSPIGLTGGGTVQAGTTESGGVHLLAAGGEYLAIDAGLFPGQGLAVEQGDGEITVEVTDGRFGFAAPVTTSGDEDGNGGDITLTQSGTGVLALGSTIDAAGTVTVEGPVVLGGDTTVRSEDGVTFTDTVDSEFARRSLTIEGEAPTEFGGDLGSTTELLDLSVESDFTLAMDLAISTTRDVRLGGDVDADAVDGATLTLDAGGDVELGGNLGADTRLAGVTIDADSIAFADDGMAQSVVTGAGGIALNAAGRDEVPQNATIAKADGDLSLDTLGTLDLGPNEKLGAAGTAALAGATVLVGDVTALDIAVTSPDLRIRTREPGPTSLPDGDLSFDRGIDWVANTITTSSAPTISTTAAGQREPTLATLSGTVDGAGAGALMIDMLPRALTAADIVNEGTVLDLGIAIGDSGHETPLQGGPVVPLLPAVASDDASATLSLSPGGDEVLADLRCHSRRGANACPPAADGSPLATPRARELRERHARLFGEGAEAESARSLLAADPASREAFGAVSELVTLLIEARLLGLSESEYETLRDGLIVDAGGDRDALLGAIRRNSRGVAL